MLVREAFKQNEEDAENAIKQLVAAADALSAAESKAKQGIQLIPEYLGKRDRFGTKVEEYVNEIADAINDAQKIVSDVAGDKTIKAKAIEMDDEAYEAALEELRQQQAAAAARRKANEESTPTETSSTPTAPSSSPRIRNNYVAVTVE